MMKDPIFSGPIDMILFCSSWQYALPGNSLPAAPVRDMEQAISSSPVVVTEATNPSLMQEESPLVIRDTPTSTIR
eukprot:scaffold1299_cov153-Ochromonas_danica.AAC.2